MTNIGPLEGDAFGEGLLARHDDREGRIVVERDDGLLHVDDSDYFTAPSGEHWEWLLRRVGQRVLDIGCGAGRGAIALQDAGRDVVALDVSPGAIELSGVRGARDTFLGTVEGLAATGPEPFDTFLCIGNNLGLLANPTAAGSFLNALAAMGAPGCSLVGTMLDPYATEEPIHLAYHEANRQAGRMAGQVRVRVRHLRTATPWFDLLWSSPDELTTLAATAAWELTDLLPGGIYAAELRPVRVPISASSR